MGNAVTEQLNRMSQTLGQGLREIGNVDLMGAQIERQNMMDQPAILQSQLAGAELKRRGRELTLPMLFQNDPWRINHAIAAGKDPGDDKPMNDEYAEAMGAEYVTDEKNESRGFYVKKDGSKLTWGDVEDNPDVYRDVIMGNFDPVLAAEDIKDQIEFAKENGAIPANMSGQAETKLAAINKFLKDPDQQEEAYKRNIEMIEQMKGTGWEKASKRLNKELDRIRGGRAKAAENLEKRKQIWIKARAEAGKKDTRSSLEKWADYMALHTGAPKADVARMIQDDKNLAGLTRVFAEWVDAQPIEVQMSPDFIDKMEDHPAFNTIIEILGRRGKLFAEEEGGSGTWWHQWRDKKTGVKGPKLQPSHKAKEPSDMGTLF